MSESWRELPRSTMAGLVLVDVRAVKPTMFLFEAVSEQPEDLRIDPLPEPEEKSFRKSFESFTSAQAAPAYASPPNRNTHDAFQQELNGFLDHLERNRSTFQRYIARSRGETMVERCRRQLGL